MKRIVCLLALSLCVAFPAYAEMTIETAVSRSHISVGEQVQLDIVVTNAEGRILRPNLPTLDGFSSYSQGHSQEISIINGRTSSRSIYSFVLVANAPGRKVLGPFQITIENKTYNSGTVEIEVSQGGSSGYSSAPVQPRPIQSRPMAAPVYAQGPVVQGPSSNQPPPPVSNKDIYVRAVLDRDEVYVNEPAMLTYTIYTRLSSTYKGFEKEPVTTGFWVEDFPPEKTVKRHEEIIDGSRYLVADIRKIALFPTQAGVFTVEAGAVAANVELRNEEAFDSFFSANVFGRRTAYPPMVTQVVPKVIPVEPVKLTVKALPDAGKPKSFNGAVGDFKIESSIDKSQVEAGTPVTYQVKVTGLGNVSTLQTPAFPDLDGFKIYEPSTSVNLSKNRLLVEGDKTTDIVIVPRKAGTYTIPALDFSYFDIKSGTYKQLKTQSHTLVVKPGAEGDIQEESRGTPVEPVEKQEVAVVAKDIRYIKVAETGGVLVGDVHKKPLYWVLNFLLLAGIVGLGALSRRRGAGSDKNGKDGRSRRSHSLARAKLKKASSFLKKDSKDEFYAEIQKAVSGYFGDKLGIPHQLVNPESVEGALSSKVAASQVMPDIKKLFHELALGRFARVDQSHDEMKRLYEEADRVISAFEKVKL